MKYRSRIKATALALLISFAAGLTGDYFVLPEGQSLALCIVESNHINCQEPNLTISLAEIGQQFKKRFENKLARIGTEFAGNSKSRTCIDFDFIFDPKKYQELKIDKTLIVFCFAGEIESVSFAELYHAISGEKIPEKLADSVEISASQNLWKTHFVAARQLQTVQTITISRYNNNTLSYTFKNFVNVVFRRNEVTTDLRPRFSATGQTTFQYSLQNVGGGIQNIAYLNVPSNLNTIMINFDTACIHPIVVGSVNGFPSVNLSEITDSPPVVKVTGGVFGLAPTQSSGFSSKTLSYPNLSITEAQTYGLFSQSYSPSSTGGTFASNLLLYCPVFNPNATSWTMSIQGSIAAQPTTNNTTNGTTSGSTSTSSDSINYTGLIVGVVVGGVVLLAIIIVAIVCCVVVRRSNAKKQQEALENMPNNDNPISYQTGAMGQSELTPVYPQQVQTYQIQPSNNSGYPQFDGKEPKFAESNARDLNTTHPEVIPIHNVNLDSQARNPNEIRNIKEETKP